jgi:uncharacterized protein YjbI with pentapeptide repeats
VPDLAATGASAVLSGTDLSSVMHLGADLSGADLRRAILRGADLRSVNLRGANLAGANLATADLRIAKLDNADLTGADLTFANLTFTSLGRADLSHATVGLTIFCDVDFTRVIGLETCQHKYPSTFDCATLEKSSKLPIPFLRGLGLPERLIEYLPAVFNQAFQYYSCFISYSTKDQDFADRIYADLQNKGVRCWFAPHDMRIGDKILDAIDDAVRLRDKLLLILSEHSIKSEWVETEVTTAFEEERKRKQLVLFPVRLDDTVIDTNEAWAAQLRARNIGDFTRWKEHDAYQKSFERVLRDLASKQNDSC